MLLKMQQLFYFNNFSKYILFYILTNYKLSGNTGCMQANKKLTQTQNPGRVTFFELLGLLKLWEAENRGENKKA